MRVEEAGHEEAPGRIDGLGFRPDVWQVTILAHPRDSSVCNNDRRALEHVIAFGRDQSRAADHIGRAGRTLSRRCNADQGDERNNKQRGGELEVLERAEERDRAFLSDMLNAPRVLPVIQALHQGSKCLIVANRFNPRALLGERPSG